MKKKISPAAVILTIVIAALVIAVVGYKLVFTQPADTFKYPKNFGKGNPYQGIPQDTHSMP